MPEFPLLKSQIGQVEWNGGSSTLSTSHSSKTIPHHSSIRSTPLSTSTFVLEYTIACYKMNHTVTYCTPRHNKRTVARIRHRTCKPYIVQRMAGFMVDRPCVYSPIIYTMHTKSQRKILKDCFEIQNSLHNLHKTAPLHFIIICCFN